MPGVAADLSEQCCGAASRLDGINFCNYQRGMINAVTIAKANRRRICAVGAAVRD
ncbi:hypothetical protein [Rhodopseudomonas palustris]|uniref:hypothetical protein n=1 Tax=Rhodopseudomonas palustris TaxID=1076 RepID=UPI0003169394|nr:hypothetical protein [Rhodopseudomonas palustris]